LGNGAGQVGGEAQPAGRCIPGDDLVEAGLVDRHLAAVEILDLLLDLVDTGDRMAELRKTCPGDEADISGSDNCYAHDSLQQAGSGSLHGERSGDRHPVAGPAMMVHWVAYRPAKTKRF